MKIVIIGSGNVAWQLGIALKKAGHKIKEVCGRNTPEVYRMAIKLKANLLYQIKGMDTSADVYIVAVSDSSIKDILKKLPLKKQLVVHTSGSMPLSIFGKKYLNHGVFYPVQTISKKTKTNFKATTVCIEANNKISEKRLMQLTETINSKAYKINSGQRSALHLAAVFANNFTNHLYTVAQKILSRNKLPFDLLQPLINETVRKIKSKNPSDVQTGPAARNDLVTIQKHLKMLNKFPEYQKIYHQITKSIRKQ